MMIKDKTQEKILTQYGLWHPVVAELVRADAK
jgi:hypothetical protein